MIELIANIISLIGNTCFTSSSLFKDKKKILFLQTINHLLSCIAQLMLNAFSGMIIDAMFFIKNIFLIFLKSSKKVMIISNSICIILATGLAITLNILLSHSIWYGFLPPTACFILGTLTLFAFIFDKNQDNSELIIKSGLIINSILWCIYGTYVKLYPVMIFNVITLVISVIAIIKILIKKNKKTIEG